MILLEFIGGADEARAHVDTTSSYEVISQTLSVFVYGESMWIMPRLLRNSA